jgi:hypothetical protein
VIIALGALAAPARAALPPPPDWILTHWAKPELITAYEMGLIADWPTEPDRAITRREAGRLLAEGLGLSPAAGAPFPDLPPEDPDAPWFATLYMEGVFRGDELGRLNPGAPLTRAEFAAIAARAAGPLLAQKDRSIEFTDVGGHWAEPEISIACRVGLATGMSPGVFAPERSVTVAEAVVMTVRLVSGDPAPAAALPAEAELTAIAVRDLERWADAYSHTPLPDWEPLYADRTGVAVMIARDTAASEDASRLAGHSGVAVITSAEARAIVIGPLSAVVELKSTGTLVRDGVAKVIDDAYRVYLRRQQGRWIIYKLFR